jgi:hypothetical protein
MKTAAFIAPSGLQRIARSAIVAAALVAGGARLAHAQPAPAWPDTFVTRLGALALIQTLNADILGSRSATLTLENWCREHRLAEEPRITARLLTGVDQAVSAEQRQRLQIHDEKATYRRVEN